MCLLFAQAQEHAQCNSCHIRPPELVSRDVCIGLGPCFLWHVCAASPTHSYVEVSPRVFSPKSALLGLQASPAKQNQRGRSAAALELPPHVGSGAGNAEPRATEFPRPWLFLAPFRVWDGDGEVSEFSPKAHPPHPSPPLLSSRQPGCFQALPAGPAGGGDGGSWWSAFPGQMRRGWHLGERAAHKRRDQRGAGAHSPPGAASEAHSQPLFRLPPQQGSASGSAARNPRSKRPAAARRPLLGSPARSPPGAVSASRAPASPRPELP